MVSMITSVTDLHHYYYQSGGIQWKVSSAPQGNWHYCTSDSTGQYLAAVQDGGLIYTSSDG